MLDNIAYTYTPGGQMNVLRKGDTVANTGNYDVLGVSAKDEIGRFEVKWKGLEVNVDDVLLLPIKGSKQISLKMRVLSITALINPQGAWSAECTGPAMKEFDLKNMKACCDACNKKYDLEFIAFRADDQQDAIDAMLMRGWQATPEKQICPDCV